MMTSSTMVFHSPQLEQRPIHFGEVAPQLEQTNIFLSLDKAFGFYEEFF